MQVQETRWAADCVFVNMVGAWMRCRCFPRRRARETCQRISKILMIMIIFSTSAHEVHHRGIKSPLEWHALRIAIIVGVFMSRVIGNARKSRTSTHPLTPTNDTKTSQLNHSSYQRHCASLVSFRLALLPTFPNLPQLQMRRNEMPKELSALCTPLKQI